MSSSTGLAATPAEELVYAEKALRKAYKSLDRAMTIVSKQKKIANRLQKKRLYPLKNLTIRPCFYRAEPIKNRDNGLGKLPAEVKKLIVKKLPTMADRACLALTCKEQAAIYEQLQAETNKKGYAYYVTKTPTEKQRLQLMVRIDLLTPWHFKLCYCCLMYIDTLNEDSFGSWGGGEVKTNGDLTLKAAKTSGPRCPLCCAAAQYEMASHKAAYKKLLALAGSVGFHARA